MTHESDGLWDHGVRAHSQAHNTNAMYEFDVVSLKPCSAQELKRSELNVASNVCFA